MQQRTFGYNPFRLPFNLLSYCTCIALIKWNSIKTFVMQLLSLLGIIRLASPGNDYFNNHLFQECPLALTLCTATGPSPEGGHVPHLYHPTLERRWKHRGPGSVEDTCRYRNSFFSLQTGEWLPSNRYPAYTTQGGGRRPHISSSVPTMKSSLTQVRTYIPG